MSRRLCVNGREITRSTEGSKFPVFKLTPAFTFLTSIVGEQNVALPCVELKYRKTAGQNSLSAMLEQVATPAAVSTWLAPIVAELVRVKEQAPDVVETVHPEVEEPIDRGAETQLEKV